MTILAYGGTPGGGAGIIPPDSIVLQGATIMDWRRHPERHGPNYLYTIHTLRVRAVYNPFLTSASLGAVGSTPSAVRGFRAPLTDVALRHYLDQPRRSLIVRIGPSVILQAPRAGFTVDAANGPFVTVNDVSLISGTKTYLVDLTFTVHQNERFLYVATPPVILSHRWSSEEDVDQDWYRTRIIHGHAVFDTERLTTLGASPDDFRGYLFHPVSPGHRRMRIQALLNEDNNELRYTIVDRELSHTVLTGAGITRIEGFHWSEMAKPDLIGSVGTAVATGVAKGVAAKIALKALAKKAAAGTLRAAMGGPVGTALAIAAGAADFVGGAAGNIPVNVQECEGKVWGAHNSNRRALASAVLSILSYRLQNADTSFGATTAWVGEDIAGKFVIGRLKVVQGVGSRLASTFNGRFRQIFPPLPGQGSDGTELNAGEGITGILSAGFPGPAHPLPPSIGLPADTGARGTSVEALIAAALLGPNATPGGGVASRPAASLTPP